MNADQAEVIGLKVLGWLVNDDDLLGQFLNMSGTATSELGERAQDPEFLGFVLDFLLSDDAAIIAFCDTENLPAEAPMLARQALPGGSVPDWT